MPINPEMKRTLSVLIVENNQVDSRMLKGMLEKTAYGSFELDCCGCLADAYRHLENNSYDVILLDLNLQDSWGLDTLERIHCKFPHLPIVINTGAYEDSLGLKAITSGAQDYLIKGKYLPYGLSKALYYAVERKKAEQDLKAAYNHLRETQAQLIQAEKIHVVGGLASGVAHEVKNPLATILYGIEFLYRKLEDTDDEQIQVTLKAIYEAAVKANRIIKDLLDFSSLSSLQRQREDINAVIDHALTLIHHHCEKFSITVQKKYSADIPEISIDRNRIKQVVLDLTLNAIQAMPRGGTLQITTRVKPLAGDDDGCPGPPSCLINLGDPVVIVDIQDSGEGISQEYMTKIFDPFFTTKRAAGGVGLGLSIARTIMHNHQGLIRITNREEGGVRARLIFKI
ncbi:MAG TPA: ATP-binding protein [Candidatus Omnitrophota bacterium]|nr:ATP-binding protein [Candidatus Omnitrophota bacterium]